MSQYKGIIFKLDLKDSAGETFGNDTIKLDGSSHGVFGSAVGRCGLAVLRLIALILPAATAAGPVGLHGGGGAGGWAY